MSGVPQDGIGPLLFNLFSNDFVFMFITVTFFPALLMTVRFLIVFPSLTWNSIKNDSKSVSDFCQKAWILIDECQVFTSSARQNGIDCVLYLSIDVIPNAQVVRELKIVYRWISIAYLLWSNILGWLVPFLGRLIVQMLRPLLIRLLLSAFLFLTLKNMKLPGNVQKVFCKHFCTLPASFMFCKILYILQSGDSKLFHLSYPGRINLFYLRTLTRRRIKPALVLFYKLTYGFCDVNVFYFFFI